MLSPDSVKSSLLVVWRPALRHSARDLIESLRTTSCAARHILNLETVVSLVAGFATMSQGI